MPYLSPIKSRRLLWVPVAVLIAGLGVWWVAPRQPPQDPNIVLIVIDALRADRLGAYGYARPTSPNIDRLARDGVVFERAITQGGWTKPSIASLFTSLYPHSHGATAPTSALPLDALTLAERLKERKYFTIGLQTNPFLSSGRNFGQGFDQYTHLIGARGHVLVSELGKQLGRRKPGRFFAYLHFLDVHAPYKAPEPYRAKLVAPYAGTLDPVQVRSRMLVYKMLGGLNDADKRYVSDLYDADIASVDAEIGQLVEKLRELSYIDNTLFIITSDHGEELFDRGGFEHGHSLYEELVRVPLIMKHPRLAAGGVRIKQLVRLIDVFPTVLGFLGQGTPAVLMGRALGPAIANPTADWHLVGLTERMMHGPQQWAAQQDGFKIIHIARAMAPYEIEFLELFPAHPGSVSAERTLMYDLERDPFERTPISGTGLEKHLASVLAYERGRGPGAVDAGAAEELDPKTLEQLRSLGYVGSPR